MKIDLARKLALVLVFYSGLAQADDLAMKRVIEDITNIFMSSMEYIFKNQGLINQKGGNKNELFGQSFITNIKQTYHLKYQQPFPEQNHRSKRMLLQAMVEVLEDNRILLNDAEIGFKGLIPATFAFQLSRKLSIKGIGLTIKFTRHTDSIRNKANVPDEWEIQMMEKIQQEPRIYYDSNATLNGKPAYRQFTPLPMKPYCLNCHGTMRNNPLNKGKERAQWSNIDMTGFVMENWTLKDFGGGVSISIEKSAISK